MTKKNWGKIAAMLTFMGFIFAIFVWIYSIPVSESFSEAAKYFSFTLLFFFTLFIYFQYLKE
jgi:hypothetical protein